MPRAKKKDSAGPTLSERAYRDIEELIVTLELPPGSAVSEGLLSRRLGIGKFLSGQRCGWHGGLLGKGCIFCGSLS